MKRASYIAQLLPILFGFFIMGFCDVVGISTSYVQRDFELSETTAGFIPSLVFLWFCLLSIPTAIAMNRYGRKRMVVFSNVVTFVGMLIPILDYNLHTCMTAFLLLGIGNTILQVSLNPLLANVVKGNALTSALTAGQVIKALSSFCGPFIAAFAVSCLGNWKYLFPIFALITLVSTIWLQLTHIDEKPFEARSSAGRILALLGNKGICLLFLGIFFIVGTDVGLNTVGPKLLMERCGLYVHQAGYASGVYFVCRTIGAFVSTVLLARVSDVKYFKVNIIAAIIAMGVMAFVNDMTYILVLIGAIGFFCSSIFSIIYSAAMRQNASKENEISGLMIMGVSGGAVIPPLMGLMSDAIGNQVGSLLVIALCMLYLCFCSFAIKEKA